MLSRWRVWLWRLLLLLRGSVVRLSGRRGASHTVPGHASHGSERVWGRCGDWCLLLWRRATGLLLRRILTWGRRSVLLLRRVLLRRVSGVSLRGGTTGVLLLRGVSLELLGWVAAWGEALRRVALLLRGVSASKRIACRRALGRIAARGKTLWRVALLLRRVSVGLGWATGRTGHGSSERVVGGRATVRSVEGVRTDQVVERIKVLDHRHRSGVGRRGSGRGCGNWRGKLDEGHRHHVGSRGREPAAVELLLLRRRGPEGVESTSLVLLRRGVKGVKARRRLLLSRGTSARCEGIEARVTVTLDRGRPEGVKTSAATRCRCRIAASEGIESALVLRRGRSGTSTSSSAKGVVRRGWLVVQTQQVQTGLCNGLYVKRSSRRPPVGGAGGVDVAAGLSSAIRHKKETKDQKMKIVSKRQDFSPSVWLQDS